MEGFGANEKIYQGSVVVQIGSPHMKERKGGEGTRYRGVNKYNGEGGMQPCFPQPLSLTLVHNIFTMGSPNIPLQASSSSFLCLRNPCYNSKFSSNIDALSRFYLPNIVCI